MLVHNTSHASLSLRTPYNTLSLSPHRTHSELPASPSLHQLRMLVMRQTHQLPLQRLLFRALCTQMFASPSHFSNIRITSSHSRHGVGANTLSVDFSPAGGSRPGEGSPPYGGYSANFPAGAGGRGHPLRSGKADRKLRRY